MKNYIYCSNDSDGWMNLARDGYFLENIGADEILLYFYVNSNAVIIGRNQNAWRECNIDAMEMDGVQLVRRHTGGGAVYHDGGNLNFSFIMNERKYDLKRQLGVIVAALRKLGITAEVSGRNDVVVDGKKFSGNAFGLSRGNRGHHGTILINANLSKLSKYLNASAAKLKSKGIDSVRSRVCNLSDEIPGISVDIVRKSIIDSFIEEYGLVSEYVVDENSAAEIARRYERQKSWEWRFGKTPEFDYSIEHRFSFGELQLLMCLKHGAVYSISVFSDALDVNLTGNIERRLTGCRFDPKSMAAALQESSNGGALCEIAEYMLKTL